MTFRKDLVKLSRNSKMLFSVSKTWCLIPTLMPLHSKCEFGSGLDLLAAVYVLFWLNETVGQEDVWLEYFTIQTCNHSMPPWRNSKAEYQCFVCWPFIRMNRLWWRARNAWNVSFLVYLWRPILFTSSSQLIDPNFDVSLPHQCSEVVCVPK